VIVHGFAEGAPDQSLIWGNNQAFFNTTHANPYNDVYIAFTSSWMGIHDRACELYQQLIGISEVRRRNGLKEDECGPPLARAVYGH